MEEESRDVDRRIVRDEGKGEEGDRRGDGKGEGEGEEEVEEEELDDPEFVKKKRLAFLERLGR